MSYDDSWPRKLINLFTYYIKVPIKLAPDFAFANCISIHFQ